MDIENYVPTVENEQDKVHRVIRAAIGLSPVASGAMLEAFHLLWQPPAEARAEKWVVDVISKLNSLAERIDDLEQTIVSEEFQSLLIAANQLVIKHHQAEKIEYFVNSIASSITAQSLTYDKKYAYLVMLDEFTLLHIRVLGILKNAIYWGTDTETTESRFSHYVTSEIIKLDPELVPEIQLVQKVVQDLERNHRQDL
ncbi:hypothetical protein, partial [Vibrio sp. 10N.222.52.C12]|uniref:hypothetical protein n=1 Tax=Vibrio sp. 10N.222.52.C12 TaxID=3229630 RepID=UPI00354D5B27